MGHLGGSQDREQGKSAWRAGWGHLDSPSASAKRGSEFLFDPQNNVCGQVGVRAGGTEPLWEDSGTICMGPRADLHPDKQVQLCEQV